MPVLEQLQPANVLRFFEELCAIPHGSGHTKAISDYCVRFARERGLEVHQDSLNNVIIVKSAAEGYEDAPAVILQGHLDMVCEKAPGCGLDMTREGLQLRTDGQWIWAEGTTLGGDDGIAVAMALAALDAGDIRLLRTDFDIPARSVDMCTLRDVTTTAAASAFMEMVRQGDTH